MSSLGLLMVISPGEADLAADSLRRALAAAPGPCRVHLVNNGAVPDLARWWRTLDLAHELHVLVPANPPRPYFEIARTVFGALRDIAPTAPEWLFKLDADTLVLDAGFFTDLQTLHAAQAADFYACLVRSRAGDRLRRTLRLALDRLPAGLTRTPSANRYGRGLRLRWHGTWHRRLRLGAPGGMQPSGGFYAVRGAMLRRLAHDGLLATDGENGLEWNDDTLLPIAVRSAGGIVCDVRASTFAAGWRWLHGSRYFTLEQARAPGLRALHPVKLDEAGRALRAALVPPPLKSR